MIQSKRSGPRRIAAAAAAVLVALACRPGERSPDADRPEAPGPRYGDLSVYDIEGEDARGEYTGEAVVLRVPGADGGFWVRRSVRSAEGDLRRFTGTGTRADGRFTVRFAPAAPVDGAADRKAQGRGVGLVPEDPPGAAREGDGFRATGRFVDAGEGAELRSSGPVGETRGTVRESWTRARTLPSPDPELRRVGAERKGWVPLDLPSDSAEVLRVSVAGAAAPYGVFLPEGEGPPELEPDPEDDRPLPLFGDRRAPGLPDVQTPGGAASWSLDLDGKEGEAWTFWWRDDLLDGPGERTFGIDRRLPDWSGLMCDPQVSIDVSPDQVPVGEPLHVRVDARASAGLKMLWWFGSGTGIDALDRAHVRSGGEATSATRSWTIRIDQPGQYRLGANARDVQYPVPGEPHQASEGCGLAYETVDVRDDLAKSYEVGFVLLAPEGTDTGSPDFQAALDRVNDIKGRLPDQFRRSSDGEGYVDVSHPTMVITPSGPAHGTGDGSQMYRFVRDAVRDELYTEHPDDFDFLAVYETYPDVSIGSRHYTIRTRVAGFGIDPRDLTADWGSGGRLRGVGLVTDATGLPDSYSFRDSDMHLLLHEVFGHQWGVWASPLGSLHFDVGIQSPNFTVLYGRPWIRTSPGNFTTADVQDPATGFHEVVFHPWMLYVAGMKERSEVPASVLDVDPDTPPSSRYDLVTTTGSATTLTLQEVVDQAGDRYDVP